jgi:oligopeptide transport system substrate-binding protein
MCPFRIGTSSLFALLLLAGCKSKETNSMVLSPNQEARFGLANAPTTFDPRLSKGLANSCVINMLYEGLTHVDAKGNVLPGLADSIHVSPDMKTYTFVLKDAKWSNGDSITAKDFAYSWNSQRDPSFKAPHSYLFSVIKPGDDAIVASDDKTLVVQLVNPTPYFLQLAATAPFFPVNQKWVQEHIQDADINKLDCVSNGPFSLTPHTLGQPVELVKNDQYWGQQAVKLTKVTLSPNNDHTNYALYQKDALDWTGAPLCVLPKDGIKALKHEGNLKSEPAAGTQFLRFNIEKAPFANSKMRHAFCLAIDSQKIVDDILMGQQKVATSFVPSELGIPAKAYFVPNDLQGARAFFEESLQEQQITREMLPEITLAYIDIGHMPAISESIKQNIKEAFNITITLLPLQAEEYYSKVLGKDYTISLASWFADYFDPMSFLSIFQYKENSTNNTQWSDTSYTHLLERSCLEMDQQKRLELLANAQDILMHDMPIVPLYHFAFSHARSDKLQGVSLSPLGQINLEESYIVEVQKQ